MATKDKKAIRAISANPHVAMLVTFKPPRFRYGVGVLFAAELLLVLWAITHQFIPNPHWYSMAFNINTVLSILGLSFFVYAYQLNPHALDVTHAGVKKWIGLLCVPVLIYFLGYFALIYGLGDLLTQFNGQPASMNDVFEKRFVESRKSCETRLYGFSLSEAMPKYFCANPEVFDTLPKHVAVTIHGLQSHLGFHLISVEVDWLKTSFLPNEISPKPY